MDLERIKIFYYVALEGSIKNAQPFLNIQSSFISKQINSLEDDLGCKLFKRHYRGMTLTPEGEHFFRAAQNIMDEINKFQESRQDKETEPSGVLRIFTTQGHTGQWLVSRIKGFMDQYPKIRLKIICGAEDEIFSSSLADVAILPISVKGADVINYRIHTYRLSLYASDDYLKRHGTPLEPKDLVNHQLIGYRHDKDSRKANVDWAIEMAQEFDPTKRPYAIINSPLGHIEAVEQDLGIIAIADEYVLQKGLTLTKILPKIFLEIDFFCSYFVGSTNMLKVSAFVNYMKGISHETQDES